MGSLDSFDTLGSFLPNPLKKSSSLPSLINLLERFYDIKDGNIRIDGMDIRNLSSKELRSKLGMVLQDTWLFSGTIYDNILYGNENATK